MDVSQHTSTGVADIDSRPFGEWMWDFHRFNPPRMPLTDHAHVVMAVRTFVMARFADPELQDTTKKRIEAAAKIYGVPLPKMWNKST